MKKGNNNIYDFFSLKWTVHHERHVSKIFVAPLKDTHRKINNKGIKIYIIYVFFFLSDVDDKDILLLYLYYLHRCIHGRMLGLLEYKK